MSEQPTYMEDVAPPPRALKWLVWFMIIFFVLILVGGSVGIYGFREWVPPRYQVAYSERFPILKVVLPTRPEPGSTLPTPEIIDSAVSIDDLLGGAASTTSETSDVTETPEPTAEGDAQLVPAVAQVATITPTIMLPTATQLPPTATQQLATAAPTLSAAEIAELNAPRPPANHRNFGFQYVTQTWNNCGPANVTMSLSYYGWTETQTVAERFLRGAREDKNVSPPEIVNFVNTQTGVKGLYRIGADILTLKRLIAAGFPVMIELGYAPEGNDWLGHYQTVVGYDDGTQVFYVYDSYIPSDQGLPVSYTELDRNWQQFTRTILVYYTPERENDVMRILGNLADEQGAYQVALETAQREARANPENGFAWFNLGKAQNRLGNYDAAATAFDQARSKGIPWRMLWYQFDPFEAYFEAGRHSDVLALVESNETNLGGGFVEETYYWQGRVFEAQGKMAEATSAYRRALQQNARYIAAQTALERVS